MVSIELFKACLNVTNVVELKLLKNSAVTEYMYDILYCILYVM